MKKRIIVFIIIILILTGGFFCWWETGSELRRLNKNLPEGIRVIEKEGRQVIVNKKDGYEIKVPEKWGKLEGVDYTGENLGLGGREGNWITIISYNVEKDIDLEKWIMNRIEKSNLVEPQIIGKEKIKNYEVIKIKDFGGLLGDVFFYYFKDDSKIYEFYSDSEESIRDVITNGSF